MNDSSTEIYRALRPGFNNNWGGGVSRRVQPAIDGEPGKSYRWEPGMRNKAELLYDDHCKAELSGFNEVKCMDRRMVETVDQDLGLWMDTALRGGGGVESM